MNGGEIDLKLNKFIINHVLMNLQGLFYRHQFPRTSDMMDTNVQQLQSQLKENELVEDVFK